MVKATNTNDVYQVSWIVQGSLEWAFVADCRNYNDSMSCQLVDLLYEWFIHVIATSIGQVHDIDVMVEHEVERIQEPRCKRLPTFRENLENVDLCIWSYSRAIFVNRSNNTCNESAMAYPVFCIRIMREINYFHDSEIGMFI